MPSHITKRKKASVSRPKRDNYLTRRRLASAIRSATKRAGEETEAIIGFSVFADGNWIVRREKDGSITKLSKIVRPVFRGRILD